MQLGIHFLSLPASWSDMDTGKSFCGIAPELINPRVFGLVHARTTKATGIFAFGMPAWKVSWAFVGLLTSRCSLTGAVSRSSPESPHSLERRRLQ